MQAKNDIFFISSSKLAFRRVLPVVFFCRKSINVVHDSLDLLPFVHGIVGLCLARSAPAFTDVLLQQVFQFADYFGMFLIDIFAFGGIVFHIIELYRGELGNGFLVHTRFGVAPTTGTGGTQQFPVSFTDGKLSTDGVVHGGFTDGWRVVRIPDCLLYTSPSPRD